MIESRPALPATVHLGEAESARVDAELATYYERFRRDLAAL
jgi:hypothetical protein